MMRHLNRTKPEDYDEMNAPKPTSHGDGVRQKSKDTTQHADMRLVQLVQIQMGYKYELSSSRGLVAANCKVCVPAMWCGLLLLHCCHPTFYNILLIGVLRTTSTCVIS